MLQSKMIKNSNHNGTGIGTGGNNSGVGGGGGVGNGRRQSKTHEIMDPTTMKQQIGTSSEITSSFGISSIISPKMQQHSQQSPKKYQLGTTTLTTIVSPTATAITTTMKLKGGNPNNKVSIVAPKKTVRERIMTKIIRTKEKIASMSKQQQQYHNQNHDGANTDGPNVGISIDEIIIPSSSSNSSTFFSSNSSSMKDTTDNNIVVDYDDDDEEEEKRIRMTTLLGESPQEFLDNALKVRGYSVQRYNTLDSAYYNPETTLLQQASYGVRILELIDESNEEGLESCLLAGIHSNPCDEYGTSALHRVCRQGNVALLEILLDNDCIVECADDFGRTPLHEACRCDTLCLSLVETLIMQDIHLLFMADASGRLPLEYIKPEHWYDYMLFLEPRIDRYWPSLHSSRSTRRNTTTNTSCDEEQSSKVIVECLQTITPPLTLLRPGARPAIDPDNALTTDLAWMVASGVIEPEEATSYMDESVLNKFLPTIHQRLNNLAAEEERKEQLHHHNKINGYRCNSNGGTTTTATASRRGTIDTTILDDLTV